MKKFLIALCVLMLLPVFVVAESTEELPIYYTRAASEFNLRPEIDSDKHIKHVSLDTRVDVYETAGEWCRVSVKGTEGWCKVRWLNFIKSVNVDQKPPKYEAVTGQKFSLWLEPNDIRTLRKVPQGEDVIVYEYGDEWCQIYYGDILGWCKTDLLWGFRSLDATQYPVPGVQPNGGVLVLNQDTWIDSEDFDGMNAPAGALVCVRGEENGVYTLPVWRTEGTIPAENGEWIPFVSWQDAQPGDVIYGFTTFYDEDYGEELADARAFNIDVSCQRIHDVVLQPGDRFSYNELCGPYRKSNGYMLAPNISEVGTGYGGGVCQLTTTLYNVLLPLPMQIEERRVHQKSGVVYVPQFFDAAVGSYSDLIFQNTMPYSIRIFAKPQNGAITVLFYRAE